MGTYPIVPLATGANLANYTVVYVDGTLTVGQATLTVTAANASRAYGAANPVFTATATGAQSGDTFTLTASSAATTSSPVGTYPIVPLATGANLANYTVVYVDGTLTVGQATLTVTAANASRAYGAANPVFSATATGAQSSDSFTLTASSAATTSSPVGTYPIVPLATVRTSRTTPWSTQRDPDGRPGHPDGDGSQRQPRLRCRQPGLHRNRDGRVRVATPSPSPPRAGRNHQLSGRDLPDRSSGDGCEPRELHRGLRQRHPDRRPGHPDGDGGERQPRLRCRQPGLLRHRDRRAEWRHLHPDGSSSAATTSSPVGTYPIVPLATVPTSRTTPWSTSTGP